jgi:hypothetical protein
MTAEEHNKTLATLYALYGGLHGLGLAALGILAIVLKFSLQDVASTFAIWIVVFSLMIAGTIFTVPPLIVAYGFKEKSRWVKVVAIISSITSLINIPLGTALSIYTFKFFSSEHGRQLYGGDRATTNEDDLQNALSSAQPLMDWAKRVK